MDRLSEETRLFLLLGAGALAAYAVQNARARQAKINPPLPGVPGVILKSEFIGLNDAQVGFLKGLRDQLDFNFTVTSGIRTPWDQAKALAQDCNFSVYKNKGLAAEVQQYCPSTSQMAAVLEDQVARGQYLSRHMKADAVDIRVHDLSSSQRERLKSVARSMGVNVVDEGDHIHLGNLGSQFTRYMYTGVKIAMYTSIATMVGGSVILAAVWYRKNRA